MGRERPTSAPTLDTASLVNQALRAWRRRLTLHAAVGQVVVCLALAALIPLLAVALDHALPDGLPRAALSAALIAWLAALTGIAVGVAGFTWSRRMHARFVARYVERVSGIPHSALVNAVELQSRAALAYAAPPALAQAAREITAHAPGDGERPARSRWPALTVVAVGTAWLLLALASPKPVGPSLARFLGAAVPAPRATAIELLCPGPDDLVRAGEPLEIEFRVRGPRPNGVELDLFEEPSSSAARTLRPTDALEDVYRFALAPHEVRRDVDFRCRAGDAELRGVIPVLPPPAIDGVEITLIPPAYTGWPKTTIVRPDIEAIAGTQAVFHLYANTDLVRPVLVLVGQRETRTIMRTTARTPRTATAEVTLAESGEYRFEFSDRGGAAYRGHESHPIRVYPDEAPTVEILEPRRPVDPNLPVDVAEVPALVASASDDVAVAGLTLVIGRASDLQRRPVPAEDGGDPARVRGRVATAALPIAVGQVVTAWFEASDGYTTPAGRLEPHIGRSDVILLTRSAPTSRDDAPLPEDTDAGACDAENEAESEVVGGSDESAEASDDGDGGDPQEPATGDEGGGDGDPQEGAPGEGGGGEGDERNPPFEPSRDDPGESSNPTQEPGTGAPADAPDSGDSGGDNEAAADDAVGEFVREHGEDAREASDQLRGNEGQSSADSGDCAGDQPANAGQTGEPGEAAESSPAERSQTNGASGEATDGSGEQPSEEASDDGSGVSTGDTGDADASSDGGRPQRAGETSTDGGEQGGGGDRREAPDVPSSSGLDESPVEPAPDAGAAAGERIETPGLAETLDLLDMLERGAEITEDMLVDAGWPRARAAAFVTALRRVHDAAQRAGGVARLRQRIATGELGSADRQAGAGLSTGVRRTGDAGASTRDALERIAPPAEQQVPAELEPLLKAYYEAVARVRAARER